LRALSPAIRTLAARSIELSRACISYAGCAAIRLAALLGNADLLLQSRRKLARQLTEPSKARIVHGSCGSVRCRRYEIMAPAVLWREPNLALRVAAAAEASRFRCVSGMLLCLACVYNSSAALRTECCICLPAHCLLRCKSLLASDRSLAQCTAWQRNGAVARHAPAQAVAQNACHVRQTWRAAFSTQAGVAPRSDGGEGTPHRLV
jgi:hypothetical protein